MSITATLKRLQQISHRVNRDKTEIATEFLSGLKRALATRGHRADLSIATSAKNTSRRFTASVKFDTQLGHPSEEDIVTLVAQAYPTHEIDWELVEVDSDAGVVLLSLQPSSETIPVKNASEIPPEFVAIGTGLYKRAVDSTVNEIWSLKKSDDGLVLSRNMDDLEVTADNDHEFKAGDAVNTPYGPGRILRFDDYGNAFVQVGNKTHLVAGRDVDIYNIDNERKKLIDYYTQVYGDAEFAKALTTDYGTK